MQIIMKKKTDFISTANWGTEFVFVCHKERKCSTITVNRWLVDWLSLYVRVNVVIFQVCTSDVKCFCNDGFAGHDCSETSNITLLHLTTLTPRPTSSLTTESTNITNSTLTIAPYIATSVPRARHWTGASSLVLYAFVWIIVCFGLLYSNC